jgi:hypothetical protein
LGYLNQNGCLDQHRFRHLAVLLAQLGVGTPMSFRAAHRWTTSIPNGLLTNPGDSQFQTRFQSEEVQENFRQYHKELAILRVIDRQANLSMAARQRKPVVRYSVRL